jgi:hypothetical protein
MKVKKHAIAAEKYISTLELVIFMLLVNIDRLKRNVSIGNQWRRKVYFSGNAINFKMKL